MRSLHHSTQLNAPAPPADPCKDRKHKDDGNTQYASLVLPCRLLFRLDGLHHHTHPDEEEQEEDHHTESQSALRHDRGMIV
ncbi:hypothetical protein BV898_06090 [Hypsibius exemplaris]|uniref:Uncharacterized protein n=1 Tax=Hypsibius exemplaris TaxID=2072580 RepID=A0A1W0WX87_HYPEX|nr:hypothetical protein BV898_06090 [Hypsibius exemplaris]